MRNTLPQILSWPLGGVDAEGRLSYASDDLSVREVIRNILLTRPGERRMRPQFGAGLQDFVHQPNNETTRNLMANVIRKAVEHWEPRITLDGVSVYADPVRVSQVQVIIRYQMRHAPGARELALGFDMNQL